MDELMRQTLNITGISMGIIFVVMAFLYVAIKVLGRWKE